MVRRQTASRPASARPASRSEASSLKTGRGGHDRSKELDPRSPTYREQLSKRLGVDPDKIKLQVQKSSDGVATGVKVKVVGLTKDAAAEVEAKAKRAASTGMGLPVPETMRAKSRGFVSGVRATVKDAGSRVEARSGRATNGSWRGTTLSGPRGATKKKRSDFGSSPTRKAEKAQQLGGAMEEGYEDDMDEAALARIRRMVTGALDREYGILTRRQNLVRAFRVLDGSHSNNVSRAELDRGVTRMGLWLPLGARQQLFAALDADRDGLVNVEDLRRFLFEDGKKKNTSAEEGVAGGGGTRRAEDLAALSEAMKRRRVLGETGQALQRRFRDYAFGDALLYALHGILPDDYSGDVSLQREEFEAILLKARVPISRAELRWVCRTFAVQQTGGNNEGGRSSGFRLHRLEAAPLINFALGMSDPWVETGSLEEILASITPEEIERMEDRQVRQGGGTYGAYARPPSSAAPSSSSSRTRAAANGYDDDDDDDDGYDINKGKFEGYRGSKVVPPGRRPGRNDDYPQPRRRRHDDRGEEEGWGAAATEKEEEREEEASAFYDPRLAFARPLFGGGPSSDRRRQQGSEWRDFKNPGGYTARGDEGVDMRRREVHHHQPVHASRGGGDYDDYYDEASAYGSGRGRQQQQQQSGSRGGDGWGPYPNLDEAFRFDEDENDGGGGGGGRSYSGAYGDVGGGKEAAARFGYGSAFGGRGGRQRRKRTVRFGTSFGREGEEEVEKAAGRNDDFYGDNDIDNDDFGAGRDYHELSAAVAFMDGEEAKQAKMLEKAMARRMVEKGGGYEDGYQGSEEAKHRRHPVVSRMLHEDAAEAARLKDVDQEAADIAAAKAQIEGSDRGGFGSYGVGSRNEKYGGGGLDAAIEESGRTRDLRPKPRPAEGVEAVPFPRQDDLDGQPNRHLVKCLVTCPASLYPGDEFDVRLRGVGYTVAVPQGVKPGRQFAVHLDTRKGGGAVSGATPRGDDEKDDDDDDHDDEGAARRRRGGGRRSSRRGLWAVDEIGAAPGVGPGSSKASSSLDERAEAAYQEEKRMREEARKRIASEAAEAGAGAGAGGRNGRGGGGDSQWEGGTNRSFGQTERANSGRQREQWWRPPSSSSGSRFYRGRPLSQAPFSTFPRGRTNRASIARARAAAEGAGDYGGGDEDDDEDDEYYYGTKSRSKYGNAEKKENRGAVGKNASVAAAAAGGGGSLRSRLGVATWEWEEEILREGGGGRRGGPRRPDRSRGPPPPLEGERAQQRNVDSTAYPVLGGARPLFGPPATNQGGGARSRSVRSAAVDCLNDGGSWLGGGRRMESKEDIQRNERKFERLMAKRVGSRVSALEEMDPEEYKTLGLPKAGTRRGFDEEDDGEGGDFGDGLDVDDPYLQPDYVDDRPLRGNNVDPATGRYPPLPGRWRARVGAAQFGRKPKVRHLSGQVKAAYRALCKGTEAPAVNVRAFFDFWDRDQDGLLGLEDLILLSMETSVSGESPQRRKGGPSSRQPWCNMSIEDRAGLENLPPELRTVDEFVQSVKEAAGRSLGSQPGGLTLGELERWLEPPDPTMAALRRKVAAQLERTLARDLGAGFVAGGRASAGEAAANLLRGAMRRVTVEVQEDTYDGAVPIQVVSQPALIKAVRRAELPLSMAEIGLLAETFRARKPEGGSGAAIRDLDYDGIVRFLTT